MLGTTLRQAVAGAMAFALCFSQSAIPVLAQEHLREGACAGAQARFPDNNPGPGSLKQLRPLEIPNLSTYVKKRDIAIAMGKALFWDMQVGSDGIQACASCHFFAGADPRSINQANPGGNDNPNTTIHLGVNRQLTAADFPLHKLADPTDRRSQLLRSVDDVISSQGVFLSNFISAARGAQSDSTQTVFDSTFNINGLNTRRSEPRNTPTVINAAFNRNQFWDGRAQTIFNGVNEHGVRDVGARVVRAANPNSLSQVTLRIDNAALASQAVGPPLSNREMGSIGRDFREVGKRLVSAQPLAKQLVHPDDSVLSKYIDGNNGDGNNGGGNNGGGNNGGGNNGGGNNDPNRKGLKGTYADMIEDAFEKDWWQSNRIVVKGSNGSVTFANVPNRPLAANEYTLMEWNFALFFGLAVQLYEMTLIADDTPVDRFFEGVQNSLTSAQVRGLAVFTGDAACSACHSGAETTNNSNRILLGTVVDGVRQPQEIVERMFNGNCEVIAYDQSFYNIGVRPTAEDLGHGGRDPFGNPLAIIDILTSPRASIPSQELFTIPAGNIANPPIAVGERTSTQGAFKVPSLRNVELTAPYFHNGGQGTLRNVVEFYNRGGDFRENNSQFIDFEIGKLNLTNQEIDDLVEFLKGLTDQRVVRAAAPFDHPQLFVPNGHQVNAGVPVPGPNGTVAVQMLEVRAVGRNGGTPLKRFLEQ